MISSLLSTVSTTGISSRHSTTCSTSYSLTRIINKVANRRLLLNQNGIPQFQRKQPLSYSIHHKKKILISPYQEISFIPSHSLFMNNGINNNATRNIGHVKKTIYSLSSIHGNNNTSVIVDTRFGRLLSSFSYYALPPSIRSFSSGIATSSSTSMDKPNSNSTESVNNNKNNDEGNKSQQKEDDESKKKEKTNNNKTDNIFLDNIGTIFLSVLMMIVGALIRSHYGTKNKTAIREYIEDQAVIDPYEIDDLRQANTELTVPIFQEIQSAVIHAAKEKQRSTNSMMNTNSSTLASLTYNEFVLIVRKTMKQQKGDEFTVQLGHLLDRVVISVMQSKNRDLTTSEMPITFWLSVLSMALYSPVRDRIRILFDILVQQQQQDQQQNDQEITTNNEFETLTNDDSLVLKNDGINENSDYNNTSSHGRTTDTSRNSSSSGSSSSSDSTSVLLKQKHNDTITIDNVREMVGYLQDTCQLVPETQVVPTNTKYPIQQYTRATPDQLVQFVDGSSSDNNNKKNENTNDVDDIHQSIDIDAFAEILCSKSVCAWGECYNRKKTF